MHNKDIAKIILAIILTAIFLIYLRLFNGISYEKDIKANLGYMDLSSADFDNDIIILQGKWEFYPYEFRTSNFEPINYIDVPNQWNNYTYNGGKMNTYGCGTYRLRLKVPEKGLYCLKINFISSAYKLIINNEKIIVNGAVNNSHINEIPSWKLRVVPFYTQSKDIEIIIQVSNYHHNKGGIINNIVFGRFNVVDNIASINMIKSALIIGVFAGLGFYLLLLYKLESRKYTYMYLALFCISSIILESILDVNIIYYVFKNISFNVISKLEYLSYMGINIALQLFIKSIYPNESNRSSFILINLINFIYLGLIILTPIKIFGYSDVIYMTILIINCLAAMITLVKSIFKKRKFAWLLLIGIAGMIFTTIIDILYTNNYVNIYFSSSNYILGLLFFLLCEIYVLSVDVIDAFKSSNKAKDMEIAFLQAQIAPHFFFNTLNNIYCLMDESVSKSKDLILNFCDFLRVKHKFDYRRNVFYSLREEIDLIKSYVKIENTRFNDSIHLAVDIKEEYMSTPIPQLLIQPIVENSIKHGLNSYGITINIKVSKKDNNLEIIVSDNGKGIGKEVISQLLHNRDSISGVGLKNVSFRLMKCYQSKLKIVSELSYGTSISFEIPENKYKIGGE
ncbi:sensor histidine kinase [Clostridium kluyveri]|uniref:Histidine kinase n=1 Tax=Clostridium kluyveri TaxID=1534 RepID=A0A1L5FAP1_CLOKL|nr:histidine kinase [Clostridium kluyveri]APM40086.1 histidine kinase [Clostridium kluyveri]UZQ49673.1 histidine kinase [Clostridium kluyveri]